LPRHTHALGRSVFGIVVDADDNNNSRSYWYWYTIHETIIESTV